MGSIRSNQCLLKKLLIVGLFALLLGGCSNGFKQSSNTQFSDRISYTPAPIAAPAVTGKRKVGKPYNIMGKRYYPISSSEGYREKGIASWYGEEFHRKKTANGETYNMYDYTAAHTTLPLPTWVRVTNLENGRNILVRVNDRGPFARGRLIDMSYSGAKALGFEEQGTAPVLVEAMPTDGSTLISSKVLASRSTIKPAVASSGSFTHRVAAADQKIITAIETSTEEIKATVHIPIYVQTGAFSQTKNAERQKKALSKLYNNSRIAKVEVKDRTFYRVRVGPLDSVDIADQVLARLIHEGYKESIITID